MNAPLNKMSFAGQNKDNDLKPNFEGLTEEKDYKSIAASCLIPQGIEVPKPETVFDLEGIPVFTKKSISTVIAKAKAGKTTVTAWIMANAIKSGINVLWFDTEQGLYYGSRTQHWILTIAGIPLSEFLKFYDLKIYPPSDRILIVQSLIREQKPDIVVIDGIRDLVLDINNPEEATNITGELMRWAELHSCHIVNIIHQNKGDGHARGHLGSELINKSECVLKVTQNDAMEIIVEPEFTRGLPFNPIAFTRDANGIPVLIENWVSVTESKTSNRIKGPSDAPPDSHTAIVFDTFKVTPSMLRSELTIAAQANLKRWLNVTTFGMNRVSEWIHHWEQFGYITVTGTRGTKAAKYSINKNELN